MLSKRKIILMAIFVSLLVILPVSAEDANSTDISLADDMASADELKITQEDSISTIHTVAGNTFEDIQNAIDNANEGDTIELSGNYIGNGSEIKINKSLNIQGNDNTFLDANKKSSIFSISCDKNTWIINLHIFNTNDSAIHSSKIHSFVCLNCTFINNTGSYGGAINWGSAVNCTFINNSANNGAAMYDCNAINCTFIDNRANYRGGAIYDVDAVNCTFINNSASSGGAMAFGDAVNCTFINNHGYNGGAMYFGDADRCRFINNSDGSGGWISSYFYHRGDAIYLGTAIYCYFEGNQIPLKAYCNGKLTVTQSGQYYQDKSLNIKLVEADSNLSLEGQTIQIKFSDGRSAKVTTGSDGTATYQVPFGTGIYSASFSVISQYVTADDVELDNIVIDKVPGTLNMECTGEYYGDVNLTFTLSNAKTHFPEENIKIKFSNGKSATVTTDFDGIAMYSVPLDAGIYSVSASVDGDNIIVKDARLDNISIKKVSAGMDILVSGQYHRTVTLVLLDSNSSTPISGEKLELKFSNGESAIVTTNSIGIASYSIPFGPGSYLMTADILSSRFDAQSKSVSIKVLKATPKLIASKKAFKLKTKTKKYTITLNDEFAQPLKNAKVTLKIKGVTYKAKTNSQGKATFKITKLKKKGTFKATVKYEGSNYYNSVNKKVKIIVK